MLGRREIDLQGCIATGYPTCNCILPLCGFKYLVYSVETCLNPSPATATWVTSSLTNYQAHLLLLECVHDFALYRGSLAGRIGPFACGLEIGL